MTTYDPGRGEPDVRDPQPKLDLGCAIVFGLTYAASLHTYRTMEAGRGEWGRAVAGSTERGGLLTPACDAVAAVRQWLYSREAELEG